MMGKKEERVYLEQVVLKGVHMGVHMGVHRLRDVHVRSVILWWGGKGREGGVVLVPRHAHHVAFRHFHLLHLLCCCGDGVALLWVSVVLLHGRVDNKGKKGKREEALSRVKSQLLLWGVGVFFVFLVFAPFPVRSDRQCLESDKLRCGNLFASRSDARASPIGNFEDKIPIADVLDPSEFS